LRSSVAAYPLYLMMETAAAVSFALVFTVNMVYQVEVVGLGPLQLVLVGRRLRPSSSSSRFRRASSPTSTAGVFRS
jgi:hypothetical protein